MLAEETREEAIEAIRHIGREHRPASVDPLAESLTCACGHTSIEYDGLEKHRAELILAALRLNLPSHQDLTHRCRYGDTNGDGDCPHGYRRFVVDPNGVG